MYHFQLNSSSQQYTETSPFWLFIPCWALKMDQEELRLVIKGPEEKRERGCFRLNLSFRQQPRWEEGNSYSARDTSYLTLLQSVDGENIREKKKIAEKSKEVISSIAQLDSDSGKFGSVVARVDHHPNSCCALSLSRSQYLSDEWWGRWRGRRESRGA